MSCRTASRFLLVCSILLCAAVAMGQVSPNTLFQLDGNAALSPTTTPGVFPNYPFTCVYSKGPNAGVATTCDYWNLLNGTGSTTIVEATGGAGDHWDARTFINGLASTNSFTTGGSKDFNDIPQWQFASHNTPDKDTLNAGYAAAYTAPGGDFETIFGADRASANGDANIGIWFFQQTVVPCPQPVGSPNFSACSGIAAGRFSGMHINGDILVISAFVNGGGKAPVSVYRWNSACTASHYPTPTTAGQCADTNLEFRGSASSGTACSLSSAFCGITNPVTTHSTWEGDIGTPLFFEGGVDITNTIGGGNAPCFTSFLIDTRSSQSTSAVLKDFLGGGFPVCSVAVTKSCPTCVLANSTPTFSWDISGTVSNTGSGVLYNVQVVDDAGTPSNTADDVTFSCGTLTVGQTKNWGGGSADCSPPSASVTSTTQNPITNGVTVNAQTSANDGVTIHNTASQTCGTCATSTTLTVGKTCDTAVGLVGTNPVVVEVSVNYRGDVTNTGNLALSDVGLAEDDNADGSFACKQLFTKDNQNNFTVQCGTPGTLNTTTHTCGSTGCSLTPSQVAHYSGSYFPNSLQAVSPGRASFSDTVNASASSSFGTVTTQSATATCLLCPPGSAECPAAP
jgi:hypothetical protein